MSIFGKRGQFYLLAAIVLMTIVAGFAIFTNFSQNQADINFEYIKDDLRIESEKVLDYGIRNEQNINSLLLDFTEDYSKNSEADNLYFLFGNVEEITVAGLKKLESGIITTNTGSGNEQLSLNQGQFNSESYNDVSESINLIIGNASYDFMLDEGVNFYFVVSKEIEEDKYIYSS